MIPRQLLTLLVFALPILVVAFAVLMGGQALAAALNDAPAARAILWVAVGCLLLICSDILLLVGVLGLQAWQRSEPRDDSDSQPR